MPIPSSSARAVRHCVLPSIAAAFMLLPGAGIVSGQWSSDPAANLQIAAVAGEQTQAKIVPTADGGAYISWFGGTGYNVYLQRLDASGHAQWSAPDDGVLVADRSFSSTQDYGLAIDMAGNALLIFRDDRFGDVQITVAKVTPAGALAWGANGVQVTNDSEFKASPKIAGTSDGLIVAAWTHGNDSRIAKLDGDGEVLWSHTLTFAGTGNFAVCDVRASDAVEDAAGGADPGQSILLLVRQGTFQTPRHLYAQKFDGNGSPLWGKEPIVIFDSGSLQFGNFPTFSADGQGGAVFSWYTSSPLQCFVQRVNAAGAAQFAMGGAAVSTNGVRLRVSPSAAASGQDTYAFWVELNSNQSQFGLYGQRFDAAGNRLWGAEGLQLLPLASTEITQVRTVTDGSDVDAFWVETLAIDNQRIRSTRRDASGAAVWTPAMTDVSTAPSGKSRLDAVRSAGGAALLTWRDNRNDFGDIYAQNVNTDGTLGTTPANPADLNGDGVVDVLDLLILLGAWGDCPPPEKGDCPADINGSGAVDVQDLLILLANWG